MRLNPSAISTIAVSQSISVVLVLIQPQGLVTGVTLRTRMLLVAPDAGQCAILDLHDDAAVAFAENACGRLPVTGHRGGSFPALRPAACCATGGEQDPTASGHGGPGRA